MSMVRRALQTLQHAGTICRHDYVRAVKTVAIDAGGSHRDLSMELQKRGLVRVVTTIEVTDAGRALLAKYEAKTSEVSV
jgi:ribosomal protein S19E (S16A)